MFYSLHYIAGTNVGCAKIKEGFKQASQCIDTFFESFEDDAWWDLKNMASLDQLINTCYVMDTLTHCLKTQVCVHVSLFISIMASHMFTSEISEF